MDLYTFSSIESTGLAKAVYLPKGAGNWGLDDPDSLESYIALGNEFALTPADMIRTRQLHTANVKVVTADMAGEGIVKPSPEEGCDGLMTNVPNLMLCTVEADCTPVYLLDPANKAVAMVHSGWRGTAARILTNAISLMRETYGTDPADLIAAIGPCICRDCYEVSDDLLPPFEESFGREDADSFFTAKGNGKYLLDLKKAVRRTLILSGVLEENIEDSGHCTFHEDTFNSMRRDKDPKGRMLTAIMLK